MPNNITTTTGEYYHVFNRGVDKRDVFLDAQDYWKFFDCLRDFNNQTYYPDRLEALGISKHSLRTLKSSDFKQLGEFLAGQNKVIEIVSYSLNPNHFHLIIKQIVDNGIPNFMHKVGTSYTNYFNKKHERSGALFQGRFKRVHIDNESYFLWLLGYVNGNIEIHKLGKASQYPWSSYLALWNEFTSFQVPGKSKLSALSGLDIIKAQFANQKYFAEVIQEVIEASRINKKKMKEMKSYLLE